jgi:hypothetical protein
VSFFVDLVRPDNRPLLNANHANAPQVPSNNSHRRTMPSAPIYDQRTALERTFSRSRLSSRVSISTSGRAGTTKTIYSKGRTDSQRKYSDITPQAPPQVLRSVLTGMSRSRMNLRSEAQRHQSKVENPVQYSDKRRQPKRLRSTGSLQIPVLALRSGGKRKRRPKSYLLQSSTLGMPRVVPRPLVPPHHHSQRTLEYHQSKEKTLMRATCCHGWKNLNLLYRNKISLYTL